ncbi:MAG: DUF5662 family protein [Lachnospiraceae bacterium]|nr:DUF5662 family protein [Lachnospiraceae bacterium]
MYIWQHFKTITKHKLLVMKYCFRIGLYRQGLLHDLSKYSWVEFSRGCRYYQGYRSPNNEERAQTGVSMAWLHHKGRNKHHFEYWIDYSLKQPGKLEGMLMPRRYVAEMIMDRISASRTYLGEEYTQHEPLQYFLRSRDALWYVHPEVLKQMEYMLRMLDEQGEQTTLDYIKHVFLKEGNLTSCSFPSE